MKSSRANPAKKAGTQKPLKRFRDEHESASTSLKRGVNDTKKNGAGGSRSAIFRRLGLEETNPGVFSGEGSGSEKLLESISPIDGEVIARVRTATPEEYERTIQRAQEAFRKWKTVPAPKRG